LSTVEIRLGAPVFGSDGTHLGQVMAVIVDARSDRVTDLVVKHGTFHVYRQIVPLAHVLSAADGEVKLAMNVRGLEHEEGLTGPARAPDIDYAGPPGTDHNGEFRGDIQFDSIVTSGAMLGGKVGGFPDGEQIGPDFIERPEIFSGIAVLDNVGEKVGELGEFSFMLESGEPVHLTMKSGHLHKTETELPLSWVRNLGQHGVLLKIDGDRVKSAIQAQYRA
jgi:uncharacterized protein YrrD